MKFDKLMSQYLLGPDVSCWLEASQNNILRIRDHFGMDGEFPQQLKTKLVETILEYLDELLGECGVVHDGYFVSWELSTLSELDGEYYLNVSFNLSVKAEDFDAFDGLLNNEKVMATILRLMESDIRDYLKNIVDDVSYLKTRMESDGFGYG